MNVAGGVLNVVGPGQMAAMEKAQADAADAARAQASATDIAGLAGYIRTQFEIMKRHRNQPQAGWSDRLLYALETFNGQYTADKLADIRKFGGSEIYARVVAMKCRGASSLLRDVYLSPDRPWGLEAPDDPQVPPEVINSIHQLVQTEIQGMSAAGQLVQATQIRDRINQLVESAREAAKKNATQQAAIAEDKVDQMLKEGGFYKALAEFLVDLPLFPFACIKGPVVRIVPTVDWTNGTPTVKETPRMFWERVSPFDVWWTPGVSDIEDASVIERSRVTRSDLNDLLDLPGYNHAAIRAVLDQYGQGGINQDFDTTDTERAVLESRENPWLNQSGMLSMLTFTGNVQGRMLLNQGIEPSMIQDPTRDYFVQAWLIGNYVIKTQLAPSPRKRHPYYITSFEKVPGTPVGNALPDILSDIQEASNATLRALINNMSIASGPQVVINDDRLSSIEDGESMYPWKRWHMLSDPMGGSASVPPVSFFQPQSNAQELFQVYQQLSNMADDHSAIPKFLEGGGAGSGAGRTASGLAMLMGNASKILQTVAANVDRDVLDPLLSNLFDMIMLTDTSGLLSGEEQVRVLGVAVAVQKETQRARQLEFLQITANPADMQIMGPMGRAVVLRSVSQTIGLPGEDIVPSDDELRAQQAQAAKVAAQQGLPGHGGIGTGAPGAQGGPTPQSQAQGAQHPMGGHATQDMGPRARIAGGVG